MAVIAYTRNQSASSFVVPDEFIVPSGFKLFFFFFYLFVQNLTSKEVLHCMQTAFTILSGQGSLLNIDPSAFYKHLYNSLLSVHTGLFPYIIINYCQHYCNYYYYLWYSICCNKFPLDSKIARVYICYMVSCILRTSSPDKSNAVLQSRLPKFNRVK